MIDNHRINQYAQSMFRNEYLHESWINSCVKYIQHVFGDLVRDKVVVDYAFGRGNWSLAFLYAGAQKVISIDASIENVDKFKTYCAENEIRDIEIIHGNILDGDSIEQNKGDIIWLYGILHHIVETDLFLSKIKAMARNEETLLYIYAYNNSCLREFTVETCRKLLIYPDENSFLGDSLLFVRSARLRARDDLTAPHIEWYSPQKLESVLKGNQIYPVKQDIDFYEFLNNKRNEEFYPYQLLCKLVPQEVFEIRKTSVDYHDELSVLKRLSNELLHSSLPYEDRKRFAIGLFNTHFNYLKESVETAIVEIFLYFMSAIVYRNMDVSEFSEETQYYYRLFGGSLSGYKSDLSDLNVIGRYLVNNNVRI